MKKLFILSCAALVAFAGCTGGKAKETATEEKIIPEVKVQVVHKQSVEQKQEYTGTIAPYSKNMISTTLAGMRIEKIMVEVGDHVTAGQLLVKMEEANYLQSKLQLENLKVDYNRTQTLFQSGGASKQQLDQLKTQMDVAQEALENLEKNTFLKSPISGVITQRSFDNGDMSGGQPILQVQQLNPAKISINIQEMYFPLVKIRMPATIHLESYGSEAFDGKVSLVYPTIDPVSHTFTTEITVDNSKMKIRPGMFARVSFNFGNADHIVVPDMAIIKQPGINDRYVYVLNSDNTVSYKKVELGQRLNDAYEILSGLSDGEKVVTAGVSRLVDGTVVKVVDASPSPSKGGEPTQGVNE